MLCVESFKRIWEEVHTEGRKNTNVVIEVVKAFFHEAIKYQRVNKKTPAPRARVITFAFPPSTHHASSFIRSSMLRVVISSHRLGFGGKLPLFFHIHIAYDVLLDWPMLLYIS